MEEKIICVHCLEEIDPGLSRCPHCGNGVARSTGIFQYLKRCELKESSPSAEFISRRYNVTLSKALEILNEYYKDEQKDTQDVLNARISKVRVTNLFNYLNYEIDFNNQTSIVLAPNGFGKTTLFNLINFVLNPRIDIYDKYIKGVPFDSFEVTLKDGVVIILSQEAGNKEGEYVFRIFPTLEESHTIKLPYFDENQQDDIRSSDDYYNDRSEGITTMVKMLKEAHIYSDIYFIRTNRAFPESKISINQKFSVVGRNVKDESEKPIDPIIACNDSLFDEMNRCRSKYVKLSEEAKNTLPLAFMQIDDLEASPKDIKSKFTEYKDLIRELAEFGLIENNDGLASLEDLNIDDFGNDMLGKKAFLLLYLDKFAETLTPFQELRYKMDIFKDIINERYAGTRKRMKYSPTGIEFYNGDQKIKLECLSSGEKNDFIMFFDLVFEAKNGAIILIDEPEISLHINWQEKYIDNLKKALLGKDGQIIISTHSPDIISTHDDCISKIRVEGNNDDEEYYDESDE